MKKVRKAVIVPTGWCIKALEQVASIRAGIALSKSKPKDPVRLPYLRVANVQAGWLDLREVKTIEVERRHIERYSLQHGDVLMTEGGDFDKLGRGDVWQGVIAPCLHQNHVFAVRPNPNQLLPGFLNALAGSAHGKRYFLRCAKKSTNLASINSSQLKQFPVYLPPLAEQHVITNLLATWDTAIAATDQLIANSQAQKKSLMHHFFAPENTLGWQQARIADIANIDAESLTKSTPPDFQFRYIALADVGTDTIRAPLARYRLAQAPSRARRIVRTGNILMATVRPNLLGYARVSERHAGCVASTGFAVLAAKPPIASDYLFYYLFCADFQRQINVVVSGSSYPSLSAAEIGNLTVAFPPLMQQNRIAHLFNTADQRIAAETRQRALLMKEKRALGQQLLTGKRRVPLNQKTTMLAA
jgi:type I restriction enzyme S subunit